jgi:very-short-patch-repair endonuclease
MLEMGGLLAEAEAKAKELLAEASDDPWETATIEEVLKAIAHSIAPDGQYISTLARNDRVPSPNPIVELAPALILRKRSAKGFLQTLERMRERMEKGEAELLGAFADLVEVKTQEKGSTADEKGPANGIDGEIFFPKPYNEEQRRIVEKLTRSSGVLVQGPPGTGKSHTIANLICHLLATGHRMLITAKTPRALQVLKRLIPDELSPLCINLLGTGPEEKQSLEASVAGILSRSDQWNEDRARKEIAQHEARLHELREQLATIQKRLREIREAEAQDRSLGGGRYVGTAARIAEAINLDKANYEWLKDRVDPNSSYPFDDPEPLTLLENLRRFDDAKLADLQRLIPNKLLPREILVKLIEEEKKAANQVKVAKAGAADWLVDQLSAANEQSIQELITKLSTLQENKKAAEASPQPWMGEAVRDILGWKSAIWAELYRTTTTAIKMLEPLVQVGDSNYVDLPAQVSIHVLTGAARKLKEHLQNGGGMGWGPFRPKVVRECLSILQDVRLNGIRCTSQEEFFTLCDILVLKSELDKIWSYWEKYAEKIDGPYSVQFAAIKSLCESLEQALLLDTQGEECRKLLKQYGVTFEPDWSKNEDIALLIGSCNFVVAQQKLHAIQNKFRQLEDALAQYVATGKAHPAVADLLSAIRQRDLDSFTRAIAAIQDVYKERQQLEQFEKLQGGFSKLLPQLTEELKRTKDDPQWERRLKSLREAWEWAQARTWLEEYTRKDIIPELTARSKQIEEEISTTIAKLAALRAWSHCFSRLSSDHRGHMEAWRQAMRRLGKGTGKHAPRHRRDAQHHLEQCREAIPAWIMPLHRVWDTVDPRPGMFDVIIVDEASQCGLEGLPLLFLGKKILVVGDDKQISPEAVGVDREFVFQYMREYLYDFKFQSTFHVESSLFDHAKARYGASRITLREHFRCMPEIIRFSNDLCYSDTPLIPLRQYGANRLPPLQRVYVQGGYREGTNPINRPEAKQIVNKIAELCRDPRYEGKTMGVVVLQGDAQARLIEDMLLQRVGAEEIERRRIVCGNPYSFQGDERDVIFLSMVAAPNERIGPFTKEADLRRFNVAASRARDQMWLFHSVRKEELSEFDLRRRLLVFFEETKPQTVGGIPREELERKAFQEDRRIVKPPAPFDSWFEVDVALELLRKGYCVTPQFQVAGKRIDLVVEGGLARLAVECDGDNWHGIDRYEEDMHRQRQLERCGWEFFRVRESAFYANKETALKHLWRKLEEKGIRPLGATDNFRNADSDVTKLTG